MTESLSDPLAIARVALALAPRCYFVAEAQARMAESGVAAAVRAHDTGATLQRGSCR